MIKHYIITAHKFPNHLKRMIDALDDRGAYFYIHIDAKSDISEFESIIKGDNIFFIKDRVDVIWGDYSQVEATLKLINKVIDNQCVIGGGKLILLSGQDYPIKSKAYINEYLERHKNTDLMFFNFYLSGKTRIDRRKENVRINYSSDRNQWKLIKRTPKNGVKLLWDILVRKESVKCLKYVKYFFIGRQSPFSMKLYTGRNWWILEYDTAKKIVEFSLRNKRKLECFWKVVSCCDELYFHTIYHYLKEKGIVNMLYENKATTYIRGENLGRYTDVPFQDGEEKDDLIEISNVSDDGLFARKFDENTKILDLIDKELKNK